MKLFLNIVWFLRIVDHNERSIISVVCLWKWESFFVCTISAKKRNFLFSVVPSSMKPFKQVKYHHQTPFVSINNTFFLVSSIFLCHHQQVVSFRFTSSNAVHHWWLTLSLVSSTSSLFFMLDYVMSDIFSLATSLPFVMWFHFIVLLQAIVFPRNDKYLHTLIQPGPATSNNNTW